MNDPVASVDAARRDPAGPALVLGAGLMGVGIGVVLALTGRRVMLVEPDTERRSAVTERSRAALATLVEAGLVPSRSAETSLRRITCAAAIEPALELLGPVDSPNASGPEIVIEAAREDLELKRHLFAQLDWCTASSTLLCTNTSGLSITAIAAGLDHPERVCGAHFWNPPHLIPLVEVVRGARTSDETVEHACALLKDAGKNAVVVQRDIPGFVGNRLLHALQREAMSLVAAGVASAEDVDLVVTQGFGRRLGVVGPLAVCDLAGLDLVLDVDRYLLRDLENTPDPSPLLEALVARGDLGVKTGRGFHSWTAEHARAAIARRDAALVEALKTGRGGG